MVDTRKYQRWKGRSVAKIGFQWLARTLLGDYVEKGVNHGRKFFQKMQTPNKPGCLDSSCLFWAFLGAGLLLWGFPGVKLVVFFDLKEIKVGRFWLLFSCCFVAIWSVHPPLGDTLVRGGELVEVYLYYWDNRDGPNFEGKGFQCAWWGLMNATRNKTLMGWMCVFCCLEAISFVVSSQARFLMFSHQSSNATWRLVVWQQAWRDTGLVPLRRQGPRSTITRMEDPMGRASLIPKGGSLVAGGTPPSQVPKFDLALKTGFYYGLVFPNFLGKSEKEPLCLQSPIAEVRPTLQVGPKQEMERQAPIFWLWHVWRWHK